MGLRRNRVERNNNDTHKKGEKGIQGKKQAPRGTKIGGKDSAHSLKQTYMCSRKEKKRADLYVRNWRNYIKVSRSTSQRACVAWP